MASAWERFSARVYRSARDAVLRDVAEREARIDATLSESARRLRDELVGTMTDEEIDRRVAAAVATARREIEREIVAAIELAARRGLLGAAGVARAMDPDGRRLEEPPAEPDLTEAGAGRVLGWPLEAAALRAGAAVIRGRVIADRVSLSTRLHGVGAELRENITRQITSSIRGGEGMVRLTDRILETEIDTRGRLDVVLPRWIREAGAALETLDPADPRAPDAVRSEIRAWASAVGRLGEAHPGGRLENTVNSIRAASMELRNRMLAATETGADTRAAVRRWLLERARFQARVIARTETIRAYDAAYRAGSDGRPWTVGWRWTLSARHPRPDVCDLWASQDLYGLGRGGYPADRLPTRHPMCFPPGTLVETASGERSIESLRPGDIVRTHRGRLRVVLAVSARPWQRGDLVEATIGERVLVATPTHPVLTIGGWKLAHELREGDRVYVRPNAHDSPAARAEEGVFSGVGFPLRGALVPLRVNLDGHEQRRQGEVDRVAADCELGDDPADPGKRIEETRLVLGRDSESLAALRDADPLGDGSHASTRRVMRGLGHGDPLLGWTARGSDPLLDAGATLRSSALSESSIDDGAADAEAHGDREHALALHGVEPGDLAHVDAGSSGHFTLATVRAVRPIAYTGDVHNLSVADDASFVAQGVAVHNCLCTTVAILDPHWRARRRGEAVPRPWETSPSTAMAALEAMDPDRRVAILGPGRVARIEELRAAGTPDRTIESRLVAPDGSLATLAALRGERAHSRRVVTVDASAIVRRELDGLRSARSRAA